MKDSNLARHAFDTFIPISVESDARKRIIFDFFDLLAAVAARFKTNGMGGRKLSRMAGWWAFEHSDDGKGFDGGYRSWEKYVHLPFSFTWIVSNWKTGRPMPPVISSLPTFVPFPQNRQLLVEFLDFRALSKLYSPKLSTHPKRRN